MLGRAVSSIPRPPGDQQQRRQGRPDECPPPIERGHEPGDQRRREGRSDTKPHALQALHQRPFVGRKPGLKDSGGNRKYRPLCGAGQQLRSEQHPEQRASLQHQRSQRRHQAGREGDEPDHDKHQPRPEALPDHASRKLHGGIADQQRFLQPADLHLGQTQIRHHAVAGDGEASLLHIGDEAKAEQEQEDLPAHTYALRRVPHVTSTASPIRSRT